MLNRSGDPSFQEQSNAYSEYLRILKEAGDKNGHLSHWEYGWIFTEIPRIYTVPGVAARLFSPESFIILDTADITRKI